MTVEVELSELANVDDYAYLQNLSKDITRKLRDEILVTPKVKLLPKGALPRSEGKAVRVKDLRKKYWKSEKPTNISSYDRTTDIRIFGE